MSVPITGAVNGQPAVGRVATAGVSPITIPYFPAGATDTLDIDTDGAGLHSPNHRVAAICGTTSGRDHFPFPITDFGLPTALALSDQMIVFWIVRKWVFEIDTAPEGTTNFGPFFLESTNPDDSTLITTESDLLKAESWGGAYFAEGGAAGIHLGVVFGFDGTARFAAQVYEDQGEVISNGDWNDSIHFGGDDYSYNITPTEFWPYATKAGLAVYDTADASQLRDPFS
jgi:hypothetical protein